jgi:hypothetical protein
MKKLLLQFVLVGIVSAACDDGSPPPPPPPPPPTSTIPIPPPPPPGPEPKDYINLQRVDNLVKQYSEFSITWQCWRDPEYVARFCAWACAGGSDPIFPLTANEMLEFAMDGMTLNSKRNDFIEDLVMDDGTPRVNRRCNPDHAQHRPEFCGRSEVRKTREAQLGAEIEIQIALAEELRAMAQQDPIREACPYDSIKGFCECRNENGGPARENKLLGLFKKVGGAFKKLGKIVPRE